MGKSTYARCGIIVNVTPLEPGWEGFVTLEFSNTTPLPQKFMLMKGQLNLFSFEAMKNPRFLIPRERKIYETKRRYSSKDLINAKINC